MSGGCALAREGVGSIESGGGGNVLGLLNLAGEEGTWFCLCSLCRRRHSPSSCTNEVLKSPDGSPGLVGEGARELSSESEANEDSCLS